MKILSYCTVLILLFGCSSKLEEKETQHQETIEKLTKINRRLKRENSDLLKRNRELFMEMQYMKEKIDSLNESNQGLKFEFSPKGACIKETYPDGSEYRTWFYSNGKFVQEMNSNVLVGDWRMSKSRIIFNYKKEVGKRGIGDPVPLKGAMPNNYVESFHEYVDKVEYIERIDTLNWGDLKMESVVLEYSIDENKIDDFDIELPGNYPFVSSRKLKRTELDKFSMKELRLMRNEIFARYSYKFKNSELENHFQEYHWYEPEKDNVDKYLSKIEKSNISLILEAEGN